MYQYRERSQQGITRSSIERSKRHIKKIGRPFYIKCYSVRTFIVLDDGYKCPITTTRTMVYGTGGSARFNGFTWGYHGEGPRGFCDLLIFCGIDQDKAEDIAFNSPPNYDEKPKSETPYSRRTLLEVSL